MVNPEFQSGVTGGEGRRKDVGLGAFDRIVMYTGVDSLQDVVGAHRRVLMSRAALDIKLNKWEGSLTVTVVSLLICSPN